MNNSQADLRAGIEIVEKATQHDGAHRVKEAIYLYELSISFFQRALKTAEQNPQTKSTIEQKMREYANRANQLKAMPSATSSRTWSLSDIINAVHEAETQSKPQPMMTAPPQVDWSALQRAEKAQSQGHQESTSGAVFIHLDNAVKLIEKATLEDRNGNYEDALDLYRSGLDEFMKAYDMERSASTKDAIKEKVTQYMERAEQIKDAITGQNKPVKQRPDVAAAAAPFLERAIDLANEAMEEDECGRIDPALPKYEAALDQFQQALKYETSNEIKSMIKERLVRYSTRIEQLKQYKKNGNLSSNHIALGLKPGEKYKAPSSKKSSSSWFGKKEKKTWNKW